MSYFPFTFPKLFVGNGQVATTGTSEDLTANKLGLYDAKTHEVVTTSNEASHPYVYFAQGSDYPVDSVGNTTLVNLKMSRKTQGINAKYVTRFYKVLNRASANHILNVGWNRTDGTTSPKFETAKTYHLRVEAKGTDVLRVLNRNNYVHAPAYTGCRVDTTTTTVEYADSALVFKAWADYINNDPLMKLFVKATPYVKTAGTTATFTDGESTITVAAVTGIAVGDSVYGAGVSGKVTAINSGTKVVTLDTAVTDDGTTVAVTFSREVTDAYTSPAAQADIAAVVAGLELSYGYIDTVFGNCSFDPKDFVQTEPIIGGVSLVDEDGNPCATGPQIDSTLGVYVTVKQQPVLAKGLGEKIIREYLLSREYEGIHFSCDNRKREIEKDPLFSSIDRTARYDRYYLQFHVPVFNNFSNTFTSNTYLVCFAFKAGTSTTAFETLISEWLAAHNPAVSLETIP